MKNSFDGRLKALCADCYNYRDGSIKIPTSAVGCPLSEESKPIISDLMKLIFKTDYMKIDTRVYLSEKIKTYSSVVNAVEGCGSALSVVRSRIFYDMGRLKKELGTDAMEVIIYNPNIASLERYSVIIKELLQLQEGKALVEGFAFKVCCGDGVFNDLDSDTFDMLVSLARGYSKKALQTAKNAVTAEMVGYMEYLDLNRVRLYGSEKERYEELKSILIDGKL